MNNCCDRCGEVVLRRTAPRWAGLIVRDGEKWRRIKLCVDCNERLVDNIGSWILLLGWYDDKRCDTLDGKWFSFIDYDAMRQYDITTEVIENKDQGYIEQIVRRLSAEGRALLKTFATMVLASRDPEDSP